MQEIQQRAQQQMSRDNTGLEERTRELGEALAIMRATLESTTDAVLVTDEYANITTFNEKYVQMWGIPEEVLKIGRSSKCWQLVSEQFPEPQAFMQRINEILNTGRESFDLRERKDGRIFEIYSKVLSVEDRLAGRVWSFRDVTERHSAEITARRLAAIVASSDDAIIGKDLTSIITNWNSGAERILGYTAEEMIGTSIMRLIPPDRQDEEADILSRIRRGERIDHFETIRVTKDGRRLNVSVTVSPIKDLSGHVVGASKVMRDITQQKRGEEALKKAIEEAETANRHRLQILDSEREARSQAERASRMKDEFLATLSHELRTPLNAVLGWASVLRLGKFEGDELNQGLETIERNARVQAQIIEDLLDMSRIISGKVRLEMKEIALPAILTEAIETMRATAIAKGVRLEAQIHSPGNITFGDPNRLQQVFWNLLSNAIKFTPKGGTVRVLLEYFASYLEVSFADDGEGIAPEFLPYIFNRFQQADASTNRRHGGLGLGLAIVKQLVELHGGHVRATSDGPGKGATFTVQIPLSSTSTEPAIEHPFAQNAIRQSGPLPDVSLSGIHVLVVDDETDARELVKRLLEMAGATVTTAVTAGETMEQIVENRPDLLVCDIGMPGEDGYSLIRRLRAMENPGIKSLPAIALSAYARPEDSAKAILAGFHNHMAKPVEVAELLEAVKTLAQEHSRRRLPSNDPGKVPR